MATKNPHDEERESRADFATRRSVPAFQTRLDPLYDWWGRFNRDHFGGRLKPPHIDIGRTAPRSLGECAPTTGYGARIAVVLNEGLVFGTNRDLVLHPWPPAPGTGRMIADLLLRFTVRQSVLEEQDAEERGYDGYGPKFAAEATRIGARLGLPRVVARNRPGDEPEPTARFWPHNVRGDEYYGDDVTEHLIDLAAGVTRSGRRQPAPPSLGLLEVLYGRLVSGHIDAAKEMLRQHIERLERWGLERRPARRRVELGLEDVDGSPLGVVEFDPWWLLWNNGCVRKMAEAIAEWRAFYDLPILADALEDAGCGDPRILEHLREPMEHTCRCWVLRGLLGTHATDG
jgi:hypothetical protein